MLVREAEKECDIIDRISSCIKDDSIMKMCVGRLPSNAPLASQPSMSRLGEKVSRKETYIKLEFASKHPMRAEMETAFRYRPPA